MQYYFIFHKKLCPAESLKVPITYLSFKIIIERTQY